MTSRNIGYYEVFALFKIAVVIQQIYYRFVVGQTDDPTLRGFRRSRELSGAPRQGLTSS